MEALTLLAVEISTENMAIGLLLAAVTTLAGVITIQYRAREADLAELKQLLRAREEDIEELYGKLLEVHYRRPDVLSSSELPQYPNSNPGAKQG